jgi:RNA polymerase sigma factor (sigma-70 family)
VPVLRGCCEGGDRCDLATGRAGKRGVAQLVLRDVAMSKRGPADPGLAFEEFFRDAYQPLVRDVIFAGGAPNEAEDAVCAAMTEVLQRWDTIENPRGYARRVAITSLIKGRQRGLKRIRERLIQRGNIPPEHELDSSLTAWEEQEWVTMLLKSLPQAQREVLACMVDMLTRQEIAQLLGKTEAAVRQNLCAARKNLARYLVETDGRGEA